MSDDERLCLVETLVQCAEDMGQCTETAGEPKWQAVAHLLRTDPVLHASMIHYWCAWDADDPEQLLRMNWAFWRWYVSQLLGLVALHLSSATGCASRTIRTRRFPR